MLKIENEFLSDLLLSAESSPRKRAHYNIHTSYSEPVQRLCIALKSGTYVRPHCHPELNEWEMIMLLRGEVVLLTFDHDGAVKERYILSVESGNIAIELDPNTWHTLFPLSDDAVIFEVKEGPFTPDKKKEFATWSPEEGEDSAMGFLEWAMEAMPGNYYKESK